MPLGRRSLLAGAATGIVGGVAGCVADRDLVGSSSPNSSDGETTQSDPGSTESTAPDIGAARQLDWDAFDPGLWRSFGGSPRNLGYAGPADTPTADPTERWSVTVEGGATGSPAVADGRVFVADGAGTVTAIDADSGATEWQTTLDGGRSQCPCVIRGLVIVGTATNQLVALDAVSGDVVWERDLAGPVAGPTGADRRVYVGTDGDDEAGNAVGEWVVYAIDAATGGIDWETPVEAPVVDYPAVTPDAVYVGLERVATLQGWLLSLDPVDGSIRWERNTTRMQSPVAPDEEVLAPGLDVSVFTAQGYEVELFSAGGHTLWSPAVTEDAYVTIGTGGFLATIPRSDDGPRWSYDVGGRPLSGPVVTDDLVVLVGRGPELYACDYETGDVRWTLPLDGGTASTPAIADGAVFVGTGDGTVYAFE